MKLLELIDELILLVTHLKYYDGPNCDLIKYKDWTLVYKRNRGSVSGYKVLFTVTHQEQRVRREKKKAKR